MSRRTTVINPNLLRGEISQWRRPEWKPLLELVGDLSAWFMWMGEIELEDGTSVHSYKHRSTRRYAHIGVDGQAYDYVPPRDFSIGERGRYRPTTRVEAIEEAFFRWEDLHHADDHAGAADQIALARHVAATDGRMAFDADALARQRRYDLACDAARRDERELDPGFRLVRLTGDDGDGFVADLDRVEEYIQAAEERALRKAA